MLAGFGLLDDIKEPYGCPKFIPVYLFSQENLYYHEQLLALLENEEESLPPGLKENIGSDENKEKKKNEFFKPDNRGFVNSLFIESLDILVMSSQDGKICKLIIEYLLSSPAFVLMNVELQLFVYKLLWF